MDKTGVWRAGVATRMTVSDTHYTVTFARCGRRKLIRVGSPTIMAYYRRTSQLMDRQATRAQRKAAGAHTTHLPKLARVIEKRAKRGSTHRVEGKHLGVPQHR